MIDKRVYKTNIIITNAFKQLIETKRIEKITIKELTDLSMINKTTFYRHYEDIYALVDHIENELVNKYISDLDDILTIFTDPVQYVNIITTTFRSLQPLSTHLIRHARKEVFFRKIADANLKEIYRQRPDLEGDDKFKITFEYLNGGLSSIGLDYLNTAEKESEAHHTIANIIKNTLADYNQ
ncbi:TetR/AcrR family transcriptional regulator [Paenibacillus endoradicis]|uniref:TetR/AcrR family transcriptional regulator n=1 Tax=Paenibacillus endoradicis TaxID=2972487 RepID=UPI002159A166|nr:TetR/AcrR family transcriptional regulator [Paenibacillus endoradicis]MCR8658594.1 TetR/AcrR family transcriptional regulator [Paenibacillus endoradicis]